MRTLCTKVYPVSIKLCSQFPFNPYMPFPFSNLWYLSRFLEKKCNCVSSLTYPEIQPAYPCFLATFGSRMRARLDRFRYRHRVRLLPKACYQLKHCVELNFHTSVSMRSYGINRLSKVFLSARINLHYFRFLFLWKAQITLRAYESPARFRSDVDRDCSTRLLSAIKTIFYQA